MSLLAAAAHAQVVVSQVYAAGGGASSTYTHDFVELFNRGTSNASLAGWVLGYKPVNTISWTDTGLSGSIPPGGYYLVRLAGSTSGLNPLPPADATGATDIGPSGTVAIFGSDGTVRDMVGFGPLAPNYEGTPVPATIGGDDTAILRRTGGCQDLDNNDLDFTVDAPFPFNSDWPPNPCGPVPACTYSIAPTSASAPAVGGSGTLSVTTQTGCVWTATSNASFVAITAGTPGSGAGTVTYRVSASTDPSARTATLTVAGSIFTITQAGFVDAAAPFGSFDTPAHGSTGVAGSIAVTGWALDDGGVTEVRVYRDSVAPEPPGLEVLVGNAVLVEGARPDVAAFYPSYPFNTRAGWGYLMLTNMLPNRGNGVFTFHVYAYDTSGHSTLLGSTTIVCANSDSRDPFGAIDTPEQGATVSGVVDNFGWVLSPGAARADPPSGGVVTVFIDGVPVGNPGGWTNRNDLTALFPQAEYSGVLSALGVFTFDSTTLADGVHTIAWGVTDNQGKSAGIGSRYFTVSNGGSAPAARAAAAAHGAKPALTARPSVAPMPLLGRLGYDLDAPLETFRPAADGTVTIQSEELSRIELRTAAASGFLRTPAGLLPLPTGSRLQTDGTFLWQPGVGFVGAYDFVFHSDAGRRDIRIVLNPKGHLRRGPQIVIDTPVAREEVARSFTIAGWAGDFDAREWTGIDMIHIWAYPATGAPPIFLGHATMGGIRPDVAAIYGERLRPSGYGLVVNDLGPGVYNLAVFGWSSATGGFLPARTVTVTVR